MHLFYPPYYKMEPTLCFQVLDRQGFVKEPRSCHPEGDVVVFLHQLMRQPHRVWSI